MPSRIQTLTLLSEDMLRSISRIIPNGGSAKALQELERRRAAGEDVHAFQVSDSSTILVGPMPAGTIQ